jgi:hypothetical protein
MVPGVLNAKVTAAIISAPSEHIYAINACARSYSSSGRH